MTRKELNLAIFQRKAQGVLWQPRLETWITHHRAQGTLPERYRELDYYGIYDSLQCSPRYSANTGIVEYDDPPAEHFEEREGNFVIREIGLPEGNLRTVYQQVREDGKVTNERIVEFPVKTLDDLRALTAYIRRKRYRVNSEAFKQKVKELGHRAEPSMYLSSSGFTELIKRWAGLVDSYYLLHDHRREVEEYLEACDERDERMIETALRLPCRIFSLGDHATNEFTPPPILERYLLPRWQSIADKLHKAGRFVHTHWDGNSRQILPYLLETGLDGVEALPPAPMGDMTLEEIKDAVKERMICLDLLPAIHFLPHYPLSEVLEFARKVMDMFVPNLILGISDEISQVGQVEKVEAVTELVDKLYGLAD